MNSILSSSNVLTHLQSLKSKATIDEMSLSTILTRKVSQSTCIRLGNELEKIINIYADQCIPTAKDKRPIRPVTGDHQLDLLRELDNVTVYCEIKSNINLDTEKRAATIAKIKSVEQKLACNAYLINLRFLTTDDIPRNFMTMYSDVKLIGVGDFFTNVLDHPVDELSSYEKYSAFLMTIVDKLEPQLA